MRQGASYMCKHLKGEYRQSESVDQRPEPTRRDSAASSVSDCSMHTVPSFVDDDLHLVDPYMHVKTERQIFCRTSVGADEYGIPSAASIPLGERWNAYTPLSPPPTSPLPATPHAADDSLDVRRVSCVFRQDVGTHFYEWHTTSTPALSVDFQTVVVSKARLYTLSEAPEEPVRTLRKSQSLLMPIEGSSHIDSFINFDHSSAGSDHGSAASAPSDVCEMLERDVDLQATTNRHSEEQSSGSETHYAPSLTAAPFDSPYQGKTRRLYKARPVLSSLGIPRMPALKRHSSSASQDTLPSATSIDETPTPRDDSANFYRHKRGSSWSRIKGRLLGSETLQEQHTD